ncbi:MAG TPA: YetF domain-containing protein [Dehalococcoidia bacterium]|nr:YetF domain-containing protein [Dehalococcoidia bacterium]
MDLVIRGAAIYLFLLFVMRMSGNRQLSQTTTFDLILLLVISEVTQQAFVGDEDFSITAAVVLILTLVGLDIVISLVKQRSSGAARVLEGIPMLLVDDGKPIKETMNKERIAVEEIMATARENYGIDDLKQVRYAVLEADGKISIVQR